MTERLFGIKEQICNDKKDIQAVTEHYTILLPVDVLSRKKSP